MELFPFFLMSRGDQLRPTYICSPGGGNASKSAEEGRHNGGRAAREPCNCRAGPPIRSVFALVIVVWCVWWACEIALLHRYLQHRPI
jgi:hypothetical protein